MRYSLGDFVPYIWSLLSEVFTYKFPIFNYNISILQLIMFSLCIKLLFIFFNVEIFSSADYEVGSTFTSRRYSRKRDNAIDSAHSQANYINKNMNNRADREKHSSHLYNSKHNYVGKG